MEENERSGTDRRRMLQALGVAGAVGVAGCLGSGGGGDESSDGEPSVGDEVELTSETERSRAEIADHLESVAAQLREGGEVTVDVDGESVSMRPPEEPTYELAIEDGKEEDRIYRKAEMQIIYTRSDEAEPLTEDGF